MAMKGWEGALRVATTEAGLAAASNEAKVQSVRVTHGPGLEALREIGSRLPAEIKEGNIDIGLTIEVHYVAGSTWPGRAEVGASGAHTEYFVGVYPKGYVVGNPKVVFQGKFGDWSLGVDQAGVDAESIAFIGKAISVGTIA